MYDKECSLVSWLQNETSMQLDYIKGSKEKAQVVV